MLNIPISVRLPQVNNNRLWKPIKKSVIAYAKIIKGIELRPKKIDPYIDNAITGVKLGGWCNSLVTTAKKINAMITKFLFMSY